MWRQRVRGALVVFFLGVGVWMVVPTLWEMAVEAYDGITQPIFDGYVRWSDARPPRSLPERKSDRERYPRRGFGLELQSGRGLRVDTFLGLATKDMIGAPDTTIALRLSDAQLDTLYDAMIRMRLFDYPGPAPPLHSPTSYHSDRWASLTVRAGPARKELSWEQDYFRPRPMPDEWKRFDHLERMIVRMVLADSGFRALPPPKGYYVD
jgi:hypothetical protein